jgi:hypothetical protein
MDVLHDDILLEIFDFYNKDEWKEAWQLLVHGEALFFNHHVA